MPKLRVDLDDPLWSERREFSRWEAWVDLLREGRANEGHVETAGHLARRWEWSRTRVWRFLQELLAAGRLTVTLQQAAKQSAKQLRISEHELYAKSRAKVETVGETTKSLQRALVERIWARHLRARRRWCRKQGRKYRQLALTQGRYDAIVGAVERWDADHACAAGIGLFLSDWHVGEGRLDPVYCWRYNSQTKSDNVGRFSELYFERDPDGRALWVAD